ncbi:hypothetical protein EYF80_012105 [Liparis tanakae]|uniref:Uncharacterized protein n=1 Tax=Liparis tanakae TaxID=230148 RepID=A0A4Z2IJ37_9TELE|nr:hypothetical protein EYF80_012105 [Liparis tanakae]
MDDRGAPLAARRSPLAARLQLWSERRPQNDERGEVNDLLGCRRPGTRINAASKEESRGYERSSIRTKV